MSEKTESKKDKFKRLSASRATKAIEYIRMLGNLSNTDKYDFTEDEIAKLFGALSLEVRRAKARFKETEEKKKEVLFKWD